MRSLQGGMLFFLVCLLVACGGHNVVGFPIASKASRTAPTVSSTTPANGATEVAINAAVAAAFSEAMNPSTLNATTFTLRQGTTAVAGVVNYAGVTSTFTPSNDLAATATYTATIATGATDIAGNALQEDYVWSFTTGKTEYTDDDDDDDNDDDDNDNDDNDDSPVPLGTLATFVAVAGAGLTNTDSGGATTLNGNVGLYPTGTCLGDGIACSATDPIINGTLYADDPAGIAEKAEVDLTAAYVNAMLRPPGTAVNDLSGMVLAAGVYTSASTMSIAVDGVVQLDAEGNANAVWIFQIGSSLTVNNGAEVLLINGAQPKNVFWATFASATLGSNVSFQGSVLAGASNSVGSDSAIVGRLLCMTGQITLLSDTITLPPN